MTTMRADVPAYDADGMSAIGRYRHEISRRITIGILPESRRDPITPESLREERKKKRHADASQRHRLQSECGCGQMCGYVSHNIADQLAAIERMEAPAAETIAEPFTAQTLLRDAAPLRRRARVA